MSRAFRAAPRRAKLRQMDWDTAEEIKRHLNVVSEGLRSEIRTVAEGLQGFREEVAAEFKTVREENAEVKAMIRVAFGEIDFVVDRITTVKR